MLLTAVMYALLILVFWLVAKLLRLRDSHSHVFQASLIFGNAGFIGIPLIMALWPQNGAIYVALMSIIDQTLLWTYGVWLCEPVAEAAGDAASDYSPAVTRPSFGIRVLGLLKRFVNPAFIGVMLAFPLAFYALLTALTGALPQLPITHDMVLMITVIAGLPTMTTIAMFTGRKNNMPEYAVGFVLVSTLFSLASLTIVSTVVL